MDNVRPRTVDTSAFSYSKRTPKADPHRFTKKGTGNGGMMVPKLQIALSPSEAPPGMGASLSAPSLASPLAIAAKLSHSPTRPSSKLSPVRPGSTAFGKRPNPPNTELRRCNPTLCFSSLFSFFFSLFRCFLFFNFFLIFHILC